MTENMRTNQGEIEFAEWLIQLGNGTLTNIEGLDTDLIEVPNRFLVKKPLISATFGDDIESSQPELFRDRAILTPKNEDALKINDDIMHRFKGEFHTYLSIDTLDTNDEEERQNYPTEFLNTLNLSGMPPHELKLKGVVVMLLRNLNSNKGLCNGTRMTVTRLNDNVIEATVLTGKAKDTTVFIPRIDLIPTDTDYPFVLRRRQFPLIPAFCMTINKSQVIIICFYKIMILCIQRHIG